MSARGLDPDCINPSGRNLVAFSGGPDSVCLLHLLSRSRHAVNIEVVHVDHGLDPASGERAENARELAAALGFDCAIERVTADGDGGPEAAARHARYRALAARMRSGDYLLTAHHADDQAETALLRLLRGAGPRGLAAMQPRRRLDPGWLTRPLLRWSRDEILDWLRRHELSAIDDPTNQDLALDRNFLRHRVMPLLGQRWPDARDTLVRVAELQRDAANAVDLRAALDLEQLQHPALPAHGLPAAPRLDLRDWLALDPPRALALLRHWCARHSVPPPGHRRLEEFLRQCRDGADDRQPTLHTSKMRLASWHGWLWLEPSPLPNDDWNREWRDSDSTELPAGGRLIWRGAAREDFGQDWRLGPVQAGERIQLHRDGPRRKLAELMREHEIPPWRRAWAPCLRIDGDVRALGPELLDAEFNAWCQRTGSELEWQTDHRSLLP